MRENHSTHCDMSMMGTQVGGGGGGDGGKLRWEVISRHLGHLYKLKVEYLVDDPG